MPIFDKSGFKNGFTIYEFISLFLNELSNSLNDLFNSLNELFNSLNELKQ